MEIATGIFSRLGTLLSSNQICQNTNTLNKNNKQARGFSQNDVIAAILKVQRLIRNPTSFIDMHWRNNRAKCHPNVI